MANKFDTVKLEIFNKKKSLSESKQWRLFSEAVWSGPALFLAIFAGN